MATCTVIGADMMTQVESLEKQALEITVNFGIFFDGTANQRLQVTLGKMWRKKEKGSIGNDIIYDFALDGIPSKYAKLLNIIRLSEGKFDFERYNNSGDICFQNGHLYSDSKQEAINNAVDEYYAILEREEIERKEKRFTDYTGKENVRRLKHDYKEKYGSWDFPQTERPSLDGLSYEEKKKFWDIVYDRKDWHSDNEMTQENDYTNVALLEQFYDPLQHSLTNNYAYRIYVTGSGTMADLDEDDSSVKGMGYGQGVSGVVQKVKDALTAINEKTKEIKKNDKIKVHYKFHVFGFSRGSTSARLFVALCSEKEIRQSDKLDKIVKECNKILGTSNKKRIEFPNQEGPITFEFVGIFDTVASVGAKDNSSRWNWLRGDVIEYFLPVVSKYHEKNVMDLGLNAMVYNTEVKSICHICALDEYRENFALVTIPDSPKVEQFFLPGAHADVGGGYTEDDDKPIIPVRLEEQLKLPLFNSRGRAFVEITEEELIKMGWIKEGIDTIMQSSDTKSFTLHRRELKKGYSYLPLQIMAEKCKTTKLFADTIKKYQPADCLPQNYDQMREEWISDHFQQYPGIVYYPKEYESHNISNYKKIRQKYLHFSSSIRKTKKIAIINGPYIKDNCYQRIVY